MDMAVHKKRLRKKLVALKVDSSGDIFIQLEWSRSQVSLIKVSSAGGRYWTYDTASSGQVHVLGGGNLQLDPSGDAIFTGYTGGSLNGTNNLGDIVVCKITSQGAESYILQTGTDASDTSTALAVDSSGNAYVAGTTTGSLPGFSASGGEDAIIIKVSASGSVLWNLQVGGSDHDRFNAMQLHASGYLFAAGSGALDGLPSAGGTDFLLCAVDAVAGTLVWAHQAGSSGLDQGAHYLRLDDAGDAYVAGTSGSHKCRTKRASKPKNQESESQKKALTRNLTKK
ncbi:CACNA1A [Symbiodinium natans]|uniref:CACNA1A protein n=1 Tax=Symbiodinium natans TaxID=878477 RepID=A0A812PEC0_9DINO|nr:CACNA1A [Symbiodinium natans]